MRRPHHCDYARRALSRMATAALLLFSAVLASCGGGAGGGAGGGGGSVGPPNFQNAFEGFNSAGQRFSMVLFPSAGATNAVSGSFDSDTSRVNLYDAATGTSTPFPIAGTFNGANFTLTIATAAAPVAPSYTGAFIETDTVELRSAGSETLLLRRTGNFTAAVAGNWSGQDGAGRPWFLQFRVEDGFENGDATFLVRGTEIFEGRSAPFAGNITVQAISLRIARQSGTTTVTGRFPATGTQTDGDTMTFSGSARLTRGGAADSRSVIYSTALTPLLVRADLLGQQRSELAAPGTLFSIDNSVVSPDRSQVAYTLFGGGGADLFVYDFSTQQTTQLTSVSAAGGSVSANFAWSPDSSTLAFIMKQVSDGPYDVCIVRPNGTGFRRLSNSTTLSFGDFRWAPSGARIAYKAKEFAGANSRYDLYVDVLDGTPRRAVSKLTSNTQTVGTFEWSPAGDRLAFISNQRGVTFELFVAPDTGLTNTPVQTLLNANREVRNYAWSPAGTRIAFASDVDADGQYDLFTVLADGTGAVLLSDLPAASASVSPYGFSWSPNSLSIALSAADGPTSLMRLYRAAHDGAGDPLLVWDATSTFGIDGNSPPLWRPDGDRIVYAITDNASTDLIISALDGSARRTIAHAAVGGWYYASSWSPDGSRLVFMPANDAASPLLSVADADGSNAHDVTGIRSASAAVSQYRWVRDSARLLYTSTQDAPPAPLFPPPPELFLAYASGTSAIKLSETPGMLSSVLTFEEL